MKFFALGTVVVVVLAIVAWMCVGRSSKGSREKFTAKQLACRVTEQASLAYPTNEDALCGEDSGGDEPGTTFTPFEECVKQYVRSDGYEHRPGSMVGRYICKQDPTPREKCIGDSIKKGEPFSLARDYRCPESMFETSAPVMTFAPATKPPTKPPTLKPAPKPTIKPVGKKCAFKKGEVVRCKKTGVIYLGTGSALRKFDAPGWAAVRKRRPKRVPRDVSCSDIARCNAGVAANAKNLASNLALIDAGRSG